MQTMDKRFDQLSRAARRSHLANIRTTDREIVGIYQRAAKQLGEKLGKTKVGSLTERWLKDYKTVLEDTVGDMRDSLEGVIRGGARRSAKLPAKVTNAWLGEIFGAIGMDDSFRSVLSSAPTDALRSMLDGKMYSDHRTLSGRIWDDVGRLNFGIEEVVSQGIAQKQSAYQIAKALEAYVNPDAAAPSDWRAVYPDIPFAVNVDYNAQRLARTAINHAHWGANKLCAERNPLSIGIEWILSESHYERQVAPFGRDICDDHAAHDEGLGKGVWPVDKVPMPHPQCLCIQVQAVPPMGEAVDRLQAWLGGASDPTLDRGFDAWKKT